MRNSSKFLELPCWLYLMFLKLMIRYKIHKFKITKFTHGQECQWTTMMRSMAAGEILLSVEATHNFVLDSRVYPLFSSQFWHSLRLIGSEQPSQAHFKQAPLQGNSLLFYWVLHMMSKISIGCLFSLMSTMRRRKYKYIVELSL